MEIRRAKGKSTTSAAVAALVLGVNLAGAWAVPAAAAADEKPEVRAPGHHVSRHLGGRTLEERVAMLSKQLGLDVRQQSELRRALLAQREEVSRVWADETVPAPVRVKATELISERTADRIRALLNEDQRKRYNPPRLPREAEPNRSRPSVETWMDPGKPS